MQWNANFLCFSHKNDLPKLLLFCPAREDVCLLPLGLTAYCFLLRYDITFS